MPRKKMKYDVRAVLKVSEKRIKELWKIAAWEVGRGDIEGTNPLERLIKHCEKLPKNEAEFLLFTSGKVQGIGDAMIDPIKAILIIDGVNKIINKGAKEMPEDVIAEDQKGRKPKSEEIDYIG